MKLRDERGEAIFSRCLKDYLDTPPGSDSEAESLVRVSKMAKDLYRWRKICGKYLSGSEREIAALKNLLDSATTLDQCMEVYWEVSDEGEMGEALFSKMLSLEVDLEQWGEVYNRGIPSGCKLWEIARKKILELNTQKSL